MIVQIRTPSLDVETPIAGPEAGDIVLRHYGWPYDATAWSEVAGLLDIAGFRKCDAKK